MVNSARAPGASRSRVGRPTIAIGRMVVAATTSSSGIPAAMSFAIVVARSQTGCSRQRRCRSVEMVRGMSPRAIAASAIRKE